MFEQFTPKTLALLLIVLGAIWIAVRGFKSYCDRVDGEWAARNPAPDSPEHQQEIAAKHVSQRASSRLIGGLLQLDEAPRYPLVEEARRREAEAKRASKLP